MKRREKLSPSVRAGWRNEVRRKGIFEQSKRKVEAGRSVIKAKGEQYGAKQGGKNSREGESAKQIKRNSTQKGNL